MEKQFVIYALSHPKTNKIRYVGWTSRCLDIRLSEHMSKARGGEKTHRSNWVRFLISDNLIPKIDIIESVTKDTYMEREIYWIAFFGRDSLVNGTDGGEGNLGNESFLGKKHTEETKRKMSNSQKGRVVSKETRKKISESNKGRVAPNKGKKASEESKRKQSIAMRGKIPWNKGKKMTSKYKEFLSERKILLMTDEKRKNISEGRKGQPAPNKHKKLNVDSSSEYIGVSWHKQSERWRARIVLSGTRKHIGGFLSEVLAAQNFDLRICLEYGIKSEYDLNFPELKPKYKKLIKQGIMKITEELK